MNSFALVFAAVILIATPAIYIIGQALGWKKYPSSLLGIYFPDVNEINSPLKVIYIIGALLVFGIGVLLLARELGI